MDEGSTDPLEVGREFVHALSAKESAALASLLDPKIDFRGLTPSSEWRAESPDAVLEILLGSWFEPTDHIREVIAVRTRSVADRNHLLYRFRVENDDGSLICAGYRPWVEVDSTPSLPRR